MANINIDQLANEISKELQMYSQDILEEINATSDRVAKSTVKKLKSSSPKLHGGYAKSWKYVTEESLGEKKRIIYNKQGWKPHLLENGHVLAGGDRTESKPHIRPAEQEAIEQFTSEVEGAIKNAGTL